jgi:hypothetical protein
MKRYIFLFSIFFNMYAFGMDVDISSMTIHQLYDHIDNNFSKYRHHPSTIYTFWDKVDELCKVSEGHIAQLQWKTNKIVIFSTLVGGFLLNSYIAMFMYEVKQQTVYDRFFNSFTLKNDLDQKIGPSLILRFLGIGCFIKGIVNWSNFETNKDSLERHKKLKTWLEPELDKKPVELVKKSLKSRFMKFFQK